MSRAWVAGVCASITVATGLFALSGPAGGASSFVSRKGTQLSVNGAAYRFTGLNIYNANSNGLCWYAMNGSILDDTLNEVGPGKGVFRAWFFQQLATTGSARDWTTFDRTLAKAKAHGFKVIATLVDQWGNCGSTVTGGYKGPSWYQSGYRQPDPVGTVSYRDFVAEVAARYKNDSTVLAWQLVNEPEVGDCTTVPESSAHNILRSFAADVSGLIKSNDPNHLVSLGTLGTGQCGAQGADYQDVMSVTTLDLCEYHDYDAAKTMPGDQYNGLQVRLDQCKALHKPLVVGEVGIKPKDVGGTLAARAKRIRTKLAAQFRAGIAGALVWAWDKDGSKLDDYDVGPRDPSLAVLRTALVPSAPRHPVSSAGNGRATVHWTAPVARGGTPISGYVVTPHLGSVAQAPRTFAGSARTVVVTGLTNAKTYTFTVVAQNASGKGPRSSASNAITAGTPAPPGQVVATQVATSTVHVAFSSPTDNGAPVTGYVARCTSTNGGVAQSGAASASPVTVSTLTAGKRYTCTARASNSRGTGAASRPSNTVIA